MVRFLQMQQDRYAEEMFRIQKTSSTGGGFLRLSLRSNPDRVSTVADLQCNENGDSLYYTVPATVG